MSIQIYIIIRDTNTKYFDYQIGKTILADWQMHLKNKRVNYELCKRRQKEATKKLMYLQRVCKMDGRNERHTNGMRLAREDFARHFVLPSTPKRVLCNACLDMSNEEIPVR